MVAVRSFGPLGLVIICDLDFVGIARLPSKTHPVLGVDPNAVLVVRGTTESFQPIARGNGQVPQVPYAIDLVKFPSGDVPQRSRTGSFGSR